MTTTTYSTSRSPALFWGAWVVASVLGMLAAVVVAISVGYGLGEIVARALGETAGAITAGLGFGLGIGGGLSLAQWAVLRARLPGSVGYAWAGALGAMLVFPALFVYVAGQTFNNEVLTSLLSGALLGLAMGAAQWLALRGKLPAAWMGVSTVSMAVSFTLLLALSGEDRELLTAVVSGLAHGALSGAGMLWVLKGRISSQG